MIWAIITLGALLLGSTVVRMVARPLRALAALVGTGAIVFVFFLSLAITTSAENSEPMGGFSHAQLEADRVMTEWMATAVGPGMQSLMVTDGMLERSANDAYLRALEQHVYQVDRMLGRGP